MTRPRCWITWEDHRRSRELSKHMNAEYHVVNAAGWKGISYFLRVLKTVQLLWNNKHNTVLVQNPSRILAALAALFKFPFRYRLVVDRHTNFRLDKRFSFNPAIWFVIACSEYSLRFSDLTIVTNAYLKKIVEQKGGRAFVLTDPIPKLIDSGEYKVNLDSFNVFFVCTFSVDEPYREVIAAADLLNDDVLIQISGNYLKSGLDLEHIPNNVNLKGFVPAKEYDKILQESDVILAFTNAEWCLVCGGYEAIAAEKPLITSKTQALKEYYGNAAIQILHDPQHIADAIQTVRLRYEEYHKRIREFKSLKLGKFEKDSRELSDVIETL